MGQAKELSAFHFDAWGNGNPDYMIKNGTYGDYRQILLDLHYYTIESIRRFDELWEQIPVEERKRRRDIVIEDSTLKVRPALDGSGRMVIRREPSCGCNESPARRNAEHQRKAKGKAMKDVKIDFSSEIPIQVIPQEEEKVTMAVPRRLGRPPKMTITSGILESVPA